MAKNNLVYVNTNGNSYSSYDVAEKVNTKVESNKEEKKMAKDKVVTKTNIKGQVEEVITEEATPVGLFEGFNIFEQDLEAKHGVSYGIVGEKASALGTAPNLGRTDLTITGIQMAVVKVTKEDGSVEFKNVLKIKHDTPEFKDINISLKYVLYQDGKPVEDVDVFRVTAPAKPGAPQYYFTIKPGSFGKKASELDFNKDIVAHRVAGNQAIWAPGDKEIRKLMEIYEQAIHFDNEGNSDIPAGHTVPMYVYELTPPEDKKPKRIMHADGSFEEKPVTPFYMPSFLAPYEHIDAYGFQKFHDFTDSKDVNRRAEVNKMPKVQYYFECAKNNK